MGDAQSLKEQGNVLFRAGKMAQAVEMYRKAEQADPRDPMYASNLSAALYEVADYADCAKAVLRSWNLLRSSSSSKPDLIIRLSTRLAKALCNGVRSGVISSRMLEEHESSVQDLQEVAVNISSTISNAASTAELIRVWQEWKQLELPNSEVSAEALRKFSQLRMSNPPLDPTLEYYSVGHDEVINILSGWGPRDQCPLELEKLNPSRLSNIAILFGGVGDARHVYGSLIGFHRAYRALSNSKRSKLRVHMTLLDIHPTILARDLCILMLVDQLKAPQLTPMDKTEINATIMYTFSAVAMPSYCFDRLKDVIQDLKLRLGEKPARLPSWLHVVSDSVPQIIAALDYWDKLVRRVIDTIEKHLVRHYRMSTGFDRNEEEPIPDLLVDFKGERKDEQRRILSAMIKSTSDSELPDAPFVPPNMSVKEARKFIDDNHDTIVDYMFTKFDKAAMKTIEDRWYQETSVLLPPPELIKRHPGFKAHKQLYVADEMSDGAMLKITSHIYSTWETNVTLFDDAYNNNHQWCSNGWPNLAVTPSFVLRMLEEFNDQVHVDNVRTISRISRRTYAASATMFESVAEALNALDGRVKLEVLCGGVMQELHKMQVKADFTRPAEFPRTYTRVWLSNVPDYTHGPMNMAMYIVPSLQPESESAVSCNCLLNTPVWPNDDELFHTYTLLLPDDLPRYLGCRVIHKKAIMEVLTLGTLPLPRPLSALATREELTTWLTRVLLNTIRPGTPPKPPHNIRLPNNLVAFFALLLHLHRVGFPGHWLSDYLKGVLSGSLTTDIDSYRGLYLIPTTELKRRVPTRRIRLDPWLAEFETIIAIANKGIPFSVTISQDCASNASDIGTFEASVKPMRIFTNFSYQDANPFAPVARLLFYKPGNGDAATIVSKLYTVVEGKGGPAPEQLCIVTAPELVRYQERIVWKMSKKRVEKMREEKWEMVVYRIDNSIIATVPVAARKWKELN